MRSPSRIARVAALVAGRLVLDAAPALASSAELPRTGVQDTMFVGAGITLLAGAIALARLRRP